MIGHSTRGWKEFLDILKNLNIEILVDIRHFPSSKKFPWFTKENLERELSKKGVKYIWLEELGGYRKGGYEKYTKSEEYLKGIKKLIGFVVGKPGKNIGIMCAEIKWWKCHRRFVADTLVEMGFDVFHVWNLDKIEKHEYLKYRDRKVKCDRPAIGEFYISKTQ
jgi:uncharacterized protein (DUF488 family)